MDESPQQADWRRWLEEHAPRFLLFARLKRQDQSWLGVAVEEGGEALESQLGLEPGSGLVVT